MVVAGFPEAKKMKNIWLRNWLRRGYIAIAVGYRLADVAKFPAAINDVEAAIQYLKKNRKKYSLDKNKIAVLGESAGAQIATLVGVQSKNKIKAIVNIDGIVSFIHPESEESTYAAYWLGYQQKDNVKIWTEASPLEYVNKKTSPTLFHQQFSATLSCRKR